MIYILIISVAVLISARWLLKRFTTPSNTLTLVEGRTIFEIKVPRLNAEEVTFRTSAMSMEGFFSSLHGLLKSKEEDSEFFSFEIVSKPGSGIKFYVVCSDKSAGFIEGQIYAHYPSAQITTVESNFSDPGEDTHWEIVKLTEIKNDMFPLKTYNDLEYDTMSPLTSAMSQLKEGESVSFQLLIKPIGDVWQKEGNDYVSAVKAGKNPDESISNIKEFANAFLGEMWSIFVKILSEGAAIFGGSSPSTDTVKESKPLAPTPKLSIVQEMEINSIENKMAKMGFVTQARFLVGAKDPARIKQNLRSVLASMNQFSTTNLNSLVEGGSLTGTKAHQCFVDRSLNETEAYILNVEELGSIYHLPSQSVETPNIGWSYSRKSEPPAGLPTTNCTYIAETVFRDQKVRFGLDNGDDRLRHMYAIGKSGTGKSTLFETMITQDIANGFGVGVLDPHGETIDKVLERIPANRVDDVIYFDPSDTDMPVGLNLLEMSDVSQKNLMASALVSAIKHHFDYSWGPRLEYLLNYAILTLLEVQGTTMLGITRLLEDDNYRRFILHNVSDPVVLKFWETEYKNMKNNPKLITESVAPIQNKVNRFLASSTIRNILGQRKSTIDIEDAMNNGKILLMNLSKGKIGEDNADLLGALLVSRIQFFALQRAKIPSQERRPFYLYVDEFQNFATGSFESILSESRKYGLGLYLTHQYTAQLPEELLKAVLGNVGTIVAFALGTPDAKSLEGEFAPYFTDTDIISLERFHVYMKLMMDGMTSLPFSAKILLPWVEGECIVPKTDNKQWVLELSRQKFGSDKAAVEEKVKKWVDTNFDKGLAISMEQKVGVSSITSPSQVAVQAPPPTQAKPIIKEVKPTPPASADPNILDRGVFDGTFMVSPSGEKYEVQANYAAKSEIVFGDELEMYKEGDKQFFRQSKKMGRKDIEGVLKKQGDDWFLESGGTMYKVSNTAVGFNEFVDGQKMYGIIPAEIENPPFCTLSLKRYRKDMKKSEEAHKVKTDQNLK